MCNITSQVALVVSILSLIVSAIARWKSIQAQRVANANQQRLVELEEQREKERKLRALQALLRPELRVNEKGSYRLYLVNDGESEARHVRVNLDGLPMREHCAAVQSSDVPTNVGPNSEISCLLAPAGRCVPPFEIEIKWDDDSGPGHVYRGVLTF